MRCPDLDCSSSVWTKAGRQADDVQRFRCKVCRLVFSCADSNRAEKLRKDLAAINPLVLEREKGERAGPRYYPPFRPLTNWPWKRLPRP